MKNRKGETLVTIIITIVIISITFLTFSELINWDNKLNYELKKNINISVLESNTQKLVNKINTENLKEKELFYIYQNWENINVLTWSGNENYKYINNKWEKINISTYKNSIYSRSCIVEQDSDIWQNIKCSIKEMIKK